MGLECCVWQERSRVEALLTLRSPQQFILCMWATYGPQLGCIRSSQAAGVYKIII